MNALTDLDNFFTASSLMILTNSLRDKRWCVLDDFFSIELVNSLMNEANSLPDVVLQQAGVGRKLSHQVKLDTRRDCIFWIDGDTQARRDFLIVMGALKIILNRSLLLGLFDFEAHFARYYENGFYDKHFDAFVGESNRVLSTVLYLNDTWLSSDGGELVIFDEYDSERELIRVLPEKGRFVVFLSESFAHQVNASKACRHSIAGWFRVNATNGTVIDPDR